MDDAGGGFLIPPGSPTADELCEALNLLAEPGERYVVRAPDPWGWSYIDRVIERRRVHATLVCRQCGKTISEHANPRFSECSES